VILDAVAAKTPEICGLIYSVYSCEPVLIFGNYQILAREGAQRGDPLGPLVFCEAIQPLFPSLQSSVKIGFMVDLTLSGNLDMVEKDVVAIEQATAEIGVSLNRTKCEIIMEDFSKISMSNTFKDYWSGEGRNDAAWFTCLRRQGTGCSHHVQDRRAPEGGEKTSVATFLRRTGPLKNSLAIPKLLYLLHCWQTLTRRSGQAFVLV